MRRFARLTEELDASRTAADKRAALVRYFGQADAADAAWALQLLAGGKPRQLVPLALLRETACRQAGIDDGLFDVCHQAVGDLAETIALVLPLRPDLDGAVHGDAGLAEWVEQRLLPLRGLTPADQATRLALAWDALDASARWVYIKLASGSWRPGVNRLLLQRALADYAGLPGALVAQRLQGWGDARFAPSAARWQALLAPPPDDHADAGQPYPFELAQAWVVEPQTLGACEQWLVQWQYAGLRCQLVKRDARVWLWTPDEDLVTGRFAEVALAAGGLADGTVLDGELLAWLPGSTVPAASALLQQRLQRKTVGKALLAGAPVRLLAFDVLQAQGADVRNQPLLQRRALLEALLAGAGLPQAIVLAPRLRADNWADVAAWRSNARQQGAQGLVLKHTASRYGSGRASGQSSWCDWAAEPIGVNAVLVYAQAGQGRSAGLYTDYSFALWSRPPANAEEAQAVLKAIARRTPAASGALQLRVFAKVAAGQGDEDSLALDRVIRATALQKFGPVHSVRPTLVCEIAFDAIQRSPRHKSGVAVHGARLLRICHDMPLWQADALPALLARCGLADAAATIDTLHPTRRGAP